MEEIHLRLVNEEDLPRMEGLGKGWPGLHAHRWREQELGFGAYVLVHAGGAGIGHAWITWDGCPACPLASCPDICDVFVHPDYRRQGLGHALVEACEEISRQAGFPRVGLGVGVENAAALRLYHSMGFRPIDQPPFLEEGSWTDAEGQVRTWRESCLYLVKELAPSEATNS